MIIALIAAVVALSAPRQPLESRVQSIVPPEHGFYSRTLTYSGIPIKAHSDVADEALYEARRRLAMMLGRLPSARRRLARAGAELHIIGRSQVTSDLPEHRRLKGKPFEGRLTVDERTRGLGGLLTSCGEENLLHLPGDRYAGRDICVHEFAHNLFNTGFDERERRRVREQMRRSLDRGLWVGSYSATNENEFFAELSMWFWGTRGDLSMTGDRPSTGRNGLRKYDPEACRMLEDLYHTRHESRS